MSRVMWKYPLTILGETTIKLHAEDHLQDVSMVNGEVVLYVEVDNSKTTPATEEVKLIVIGTGHEVPENAEYFDTVVDGPLVWHVFVIVE